VAGQGYVVGASRTVYLYQPPGAEPCPLLVVFDGRGYLRRTHLPTIVENLAAQGRIRPPALALIQPGGKGRTVEYACSDTTVAFIIRCVLPVARAHLNLVDVAAVPGGYGIMGASMGGLMALYTALRAPEIFGSVLCESGAFGADQLYYRSVIYDLIRCGPAPPLKIWMDVGLHEWFLAPNRQMYALLREQGYDVRYTEQTSGHNYPSWRNILWRGLEYLYGAGRRDAA
jgi:enterochelin esterase family protein